MRLLFKRLSLLLVIILCAGAIISGCDQDNAKSNIGSTTNGNFIIGNNQEAIKTVTFLIPNYAQTKYTQEVMDEVNVQLRKLYNMEVVFEKLDFRPEQYDFTSVFKGNREFDAIVAYGDINNIIDSDLASDLTDSLRQYAPSLYTRISETALKRLTFNEKLMAIPPCTIGTDRLVAVVRQDILKACNIDKIETFDDYGKLLERIRTVSPDIWPGAVPPTASVFMQPHGYEPVDGYMVYKLDDPKRALIPWERTDAFRKGYKMIRQWRNSQYLQTNDAIAKAMMKGSLASFVFDWDTAKKYIEQIGDNYSLSVFPMYPDVPARETAGSDASIVINRKSENSQLVLKFLEWVHMSQVNYDLLMYGIEGKNYSLQDGKVKLIREASYYGWNGCEAFRNSDYDRELISGITDLKGIDKQIAGMNIDSSPTRDFKPVYTGQLSGIFKNRLWLGFEFSWQRLYQDRSSVVWNDLVKAPGVAIDNPDIDGEIDALIEYQRKKINIDLMLEDTQNQLNMWMMANTD